MNLEESIRRAVDKISIAYQLDRQRVIFRPEKSNLERGELYLEIVNIGKANG